MKKKILNIIELVLYIGAIILLIISKCKTHVETGTYIEGMQYAPMVETTFFKQLFEVPIYLIPFIILWTSGIGLCIYSLFSKQKDNKFQTIIPIINFIFTFWVLLALISEMKNLFIILGIMILIIIIAFVKKEKN